MSPPSGNVGGAIDQSTLEQQSDSSGNGIPYYLSMLTTASGLGSTQQELSKVVDNMWKGKNGKWNSIEWGGNGSTGGRTSVIRQASTFRALGVGLFYVGVGFSVVDGFNAAIQKNMFGVFKSGVDIGWGYAATFGGWVGFSGGASYFATTMLLDHVPAVRRYTVEPLANVFCKLDSHCG